jgi:hypothetical protein
MVAAVEVGAGQKDRPNSADMDAFDYLGGHIAHPERGIATRESSERCAASPKAQGD